MLKPRSLLRVAVAGLLAGTTFVGAAWAGVALPGGDGPLALDVPELPGTAPGAEPEAAAPSSSQPATTASGPAGLRAGAAKVSIEPRPADYGGVWETDPSACRTLDPGFLQRLGTNPEDGAHLASTGSPWRPFTAATIERKASMVKQGGLNLHSPAFQSLVP